MYTKNSPHRKVGSFFMLKKDWLPEQPDQTVEKSPNGAFPPNIPASVFCHGRPVTKNVF